MVDLQTLLQEKFHISETLLSFTEQIEKELASQFEQTDRIAEYNQMKVIHAMQKNRLSDTHFAATT